MPNSPSQNYSSKTNYQKEINNKDINLNSSNNIDNNNLDELCCICQCTAQKPQAKLPCSHIFCLICINKWLNEMPKCPICSKLITEFTVLEENNFYKKTLEQNIIDKADKAVTWLNDQDSLAGGIDHNFIIEEIESVLTLAMTRKERLFKAQAAHYGNFKYGVLPYERKLRVVGDVMDELLILKEQMLLLQPFEPEDILKQIRILQQDVINSSNRDETSIEMNQNQIHNNNNNNNNDDEYYNDELLDNYSYYDDEDDEDEFATYYEQCMQRKMKKRL